MPKFSFIIPVYNAEKYLEECIESVLRQTLKDFEVLLINDGSSDKSGKICDEYADKDERINVYHKGNGGASSARNLGLDNAKGEYICFIDSDDTVGENYLKILYPQNKEDFVQMGVQILENDYLRPFMKHDEIFSDYNKFWMQSRQQWPTKCCYSKKVIDENNLRYDTKLKMGEDGLFNQIYISKCKLIRRTIENEYYYNFDNIESVSHKYYPDRLQQQKHLLEKLEEHFDDKDIYRIRWDYWHEVINHYKVKGLSLSGEERKKAVEYLKKTYQEEVFRKAIPQIRTNGSLDEKVETYLMRYNLHFLYKPIIKILQILYSIKMKRYN